MIRVYRWCIAGVVWFSEDCIDLARRISAGKSTTFAGIYCHEGQAYFANDAAEIQKISDEASERILDVANRFSAVFD